MTNDFQTDGFKFPRSVDEVKKTSLSLWHGEVPLFQTFWIYYVAGVFALALLSAIIDPLSIVFNLLAIAWAGFMVKPIIEAAKKYETENPEEKHWALAAKIAAVLIALGVLGDIFD